MEQQQLKQLQLTEPYMEQQKQQQLTEPYMEQQKQLQLTERLRLYWLNQTNTVTRET